MIPTNINNSISQLNSKDILDGYRRMKQYFTEAMPTLTEAIPTPSLTELGIIGPIQQLPMGRRLQRYGIPKRFNERVPEPVYYGGELPEIVVTPEYVEEPIYYGGELPEVEVSVPDPHINGGDGYAGRYRNDPENQSPWYIPSFLWR